jgi:hypothetical protein
MSTDAVYLVQIAENSFDLFSESTTGVLNLAGSASGENALAAAREIASEFLDTDEAITEQELFFQDSFGNPPLYELNTFRPRIWRRGPAGAVGKEISGFLYRYPGLRQAMKCGDFITAGTAIQRSKKLKNFRSLLRYMAGEEVFLIFALYWLSAFDEFKQGHLAALLSGRQGPAKENPYGELFDFARPSIEATDLAEFKDEIKRKLSAYLFEKHGTLVLPLVGENFGKATSEMRKRSSEALSEGRRRALVEGLEGFEARVRAWLERVEFAVRQDPFNKADSNALSILARLPDDGRTYLAGYLRADLAAFLTPMLKKGNSLQTKLYWLDDTEVRIAVRVQ